ncbi:CDP-diacylglycerol--glycerol-3-phosphate 3-phosphatidyltransferase, mitochondrial-like isoform X1 [Oncorhynchus keta]|uniref:CDP-diacylglycerol--glycerol-3-phosphate 3-phosphatidyltransferase, mitochondrial-like isoform X1 n=1 Tax=Oncorhynchus keta TaxID=8018 RepID=UPI0015F8029D|nr:CDP-diacylglycerol--glycerol-3-phosphate 3-phosphatidyltransferase, mitochondrial-like isoform X1 [Oncorhynchus keta]XP_035648985.1 CDP-diacylglycerol--glycerol-3-phosphate 3-phosphatidyltransferase, mitochondrial-like isoform X1 [Oncorhynchus keta]
MMAAPMSWRKLVYSPVLTGVFTRISDRLFRTRDRRRGSSVLLLAPLLAEADPSPRPVVGSPGLAEVQGTDGLRAHFRWMAEHVPAFRVPGTHIHILTSPDQFYHTMKARIKTAKRRVVMASLYLGTGPLEQELVDCMQEALERSQEGDNPDLQVSILLDYTRGSRGKTNSRTMLLPLLKQYSSQMRVSLYHTPDLRGLLRLLVPQRFNETIGVQHIKAYLFDDDLIISGANLSDSYFTNRQDRYVLLENCGEVADFFSDLVGAVGDVSLQLQTDNSVSMMYGMVHPYRGNRDDFSASARQHIMEVVNTAHVRQHIAESERLVRESEGEEGGKEDTWVFPLVQMKPLGIQVDEQVTQRLLTDAGPGVTVFLTSGYFNLTRAYMSLVLGLGADYRILTASPEVNGFFGAKGIAGEIPAAYIHIARQFYSKVCQLGQQERVHLHEYHRAQWTFHAKGLWYYLRGQVRPCLTLIGSPNFGYRSVHRDLEAQIAIVTENQVLQAQLQEEQEMLYQRSTEVSSSTFQQPDRHVKLWVKLLTPLIKNFF